jgi:hypothetical protein
MSPVQTPPTPALPKLRDKAVRVHQQLVREAERRAYADGNAEHAAFLGAILDWPKQVNSHG